MFSWSLVSENAMLMLTDVRVIFGKEIYSVVLGAAVVFIFVGGTGWAYKILFNSSNRPDRSRGKNVISRHAEENNNEISQDRLRMLTKLIENKEDRGPLAKIMFDWISENKSLSDESFFIYLAENYSKLSSVQSNNAISSKSRQIPNGNARFHAGLASNIQVKNGKIAFAHARNQSSFHAA